MKNAALALLFSGLTLLPGSVLADGDVPYSPAAFTAAQKNNEKILLHFHADWCPTCKVQKEDLAELEKEGALKGIDLMTVNYDKETELKKTMKVNAQATFIAFYGSVETARSTGLTDKDDLKHFINDSLSSLSLKDQLALMRAQQDAHIPADKKKILDDTVEKLRASHLTEKALQVGQKMPDFTLNDSNGKSVHLKTLLKSGPVVLTFYRGSWCPYCNAQLSSYQAHLADFKAKGAQLVAVTPEKPDLITLMKEGKKLEFEILNDKDNKLAKKLGLVFGLPDDLKKVYQQFGVNLEKSQGNPEWKLPIPATYIVSKEGKVIYAFLDVDYTHRADPNDLLAALKKN